MHSKRCFMELRPNWRRILCGTQKGHQGRRNYGHWCGITGDACKAADPSLSPLVKTAIHGEDPNWGRIIAAAGRSGATLSPDALRLQMNDVILYNDGVWQGTDAEAVPRVMCQPEYIKSIWDRLCTEDGFYL